MKKTSRSVRRRIFQPEPSKLSIVAQEYLAHAEALWKAADFDTAVRDDVLVGLAYIIRTAYDCLALDKNLQGLEFSLFIQQNTAEWFRKLDCAEWFCLAAASGFNTSRPKEEDDLRPVFSKGKRRLSSARKRKRTKTSGEPKP
jgi:hypothetical protein